MYNTLSQPVRQHGSGKDTGFLLAKNALDSCCTRRDMGRQARYAPLERLVSRRAWSTAVPNPAGYRDATARSRIGYFVERSCKWQVLQALQVSCNRTQACQAQAQREVRRGLTDRRVGGDSKRRPLAHLREGFGIFQPAQAAS
ncbi:uncharacterized protein PG986_014896 [Apiospora aurea]|uniref:Uncharacterized protein n=1 Tax=Apiospora aurea TaxID=335848 RepID=A0ABR1PUA5_9PEZI